MTLPGDVLTADEPYLSITAAGSVPDQVGLVAAVVAGNELLRRGIHGMLRSVPEVGTVHECADPDELGRLIQLEELDIVVVAAAAAPWLSGCAEAFATADTTVLILVDQTSIEDLSGYPPVAGGFLWQPDLTATSLREALRRCGNGDTLMPPDLVRALLERSDTPYRRSQARPVNLTRREQETLTLLVRGLSNKQIAKRLLISSHGAKRLVASVMLKLDAPNRTLAAVMAVRAGIVEVE